jgi:MFS family permease
MEKLKQNNKILIRQDKENRWKSNIWKSYIAQFFMGFHLISGVLIPFFTVWGGLTFVEIMMLQSYFTVMILVFEIPCGAIADYISRKFSLILGTGVIGIAALVYSSFPNIIIFGIGETLWAIGSSLISGTNQAFIYDTLKKLGRENEISKIMARSRSSSLIGIGISAPIGSLIGASISLPLVMRLMFVPMMVAVIISLSFKEPNDDLQKKEKKNYINVIKSGIKEISGNNILRILAFELVIIEALIFFLLWTYQVYLESLSFSIGLFGFVSTSLTLIQIMFNNLSPKLESRIIKKRLFVQIYTIIPGIGFIMMAWVTFIPASIFLILLVIGLGFSRSILFTKGINKRIESENRATVISTISMISCLLRSILYPIIGYLTMNNLSMTFVFLGSLIIIFALFSRIKNEYI